MKFKAAETIQVGDILEVTRSTKRGYFFKVSRICHLKQCIEFVDSNDKYFLHKICKKVDPSNEREMTLITRIIDLQNKNEEISKENEQLKTGLMRSVKYSNSISLAAKELFQASEYVYKTHMEMYKKHIEHKEENQ